RPFDAKANVVTGLPSALDPGVTVAGPSKPLCQPAAARSGSNSASQYVTPLVENVPGTVNVKAGACGSETSAENCSLRYAIALKAPSSRTCSAAVRRERDSAGADASA